MITNFVVRACGRLREVVWGVGLGKSLAGHSLCPDVQFDPVTASLRAWFSVHMERRSHQLRLW